MAKALFEKDYSKENPGLHALYVKFAVKHLTMLDSAIKMFFEQSNINTFDTAYILEKEKNRLIKTDKAYHDAAEILEEIRPIIHSTNPGGYDYHKDAPDGFSD